MPAVAVVVRAGAGQVPAWAEAAGPAHALDPAALDDGDADGVLARAECALVDGALGEPLAAARRIHAADPTLQTVLVAPPEAAARLRQALLFTPGLGEVWLAEPQQVDAALLERAAAVTRQRRRYRTARPGIERSLASAAAAPPRRARLSDAYLASLVQSLPDPVISVGERGEVLSWNPAAERVLGYAPHEVAGRPLAEVLFPEDPGPAERLLARARVDPYRSELAFRRAGGEEGVGEVIVSPVEADGRAVRCVIVHDLTEQRRAQAELESQAGELQEQAAELEMLNDELHQRTRDLETALGARSRFYAAMSHELRTPINAVIGYNALLLDGIYGPLAARQEEGIRRAQRAAHHLLELVNDVLDLAKIEAGRVELQVETVPVGPLLREVADTVRPAAHAGGSSVEVSGAPESLRVDTDPRRVRQILLNLVSNAVKFGGGKPILLRWEEAPDGGVVLDVVDRGRGIAPEHQQRIFDEFEQVGPREDGGTGLGLPISRRLAHLLGGSLTVRSTPGEGSTFTLVLPPAAGAPAAHPQI
ncbi:MAG TPA: PAS domain-containing sensor histidine kinase [Longimicrobiaceae bacterium]|nr:PAS domain-containing sensor histidine kinase [Longimicrobiaceae bacterium]